MKKLFFIVALSIGLMFSSPTFVGAEAPDHTEQFYVNDFANVLNDETKQHIVETSKKLDEETGAQIVVTTIKDLGDFSLENLALEMLRQWGIGDNEKNSGLLILVVTDSRYLRVEVGQGLEGILPDGKVGRLEDEHMVPMLKEDKWDEAVKRGYDAFYATIDANREEIGKGSGEMANNWFITLVAFIIFLAPIWLIIVLAIYMKKHPEKFKNLGSDNDGGRSGGSSGGWRSGGGGSSSSSGGGYSGGGGSGGGGGASRRF